MPPTIMPPQLILTIAAVIVCYLVFQWLVKVIKASVTTAVSIVLILLALQLGFGIFPQEVGNKILQLPQTLQELFQNNNY